VPCCGDVLRVAVVDALDSRNMTDGTQGCATNLADALSDVVGDAKELIPMFQQTGGSREIEGRSYANESSSS
jgi:hypothetical protein